MSDLIDKISQADAEALERLLLAVLRRYAVLFPDWEVSTVSFRKGIDKNTQIDQFINLLTSMKTTHMDSSP